jgi:hypothetical protein
LAFFLVSACSASFTAQSTLHQFCRGLVGVNGVLQCLHLRIAAACLAKFDAPKKLQGPALLCPVQAICARVKVPAYQLAEWLGLWLASQ